MIQMVELEYLTQQTVDAVRMIRQEDISEAQ